MEAPEDKTLHDAVSRKLHASRLGYFSDPFISVFSRDDTLVNSPLMNRGYWLRVRAVERAIEVFAASLPDPQATPFQVVSIGAGLDTLFLKWAQAFDHVSLPQPPDIPGHGHHAALPFSPQLASSFPRLHRFIEVDRPAVMEHKRHIIERHEALMSRFVAHKSAVDGRLVYRTLGVDLTGGKQALLEKLAEARGAEGSSDAAPAPASSPSATAASFFDPNMPTIFIAECVLVYLKKSVSDDVLTCFFNEWCSSANPHVALVNYDAIQPTTRFGQTMVANLRQMGIELHGIHDLPTPKAHEERCKALGLLSVKAWTMTQLYLQVNPAVLKRLDAIEPIDDWDEWKLVHDHYGFVFAKRSGDATTSLFPPFVPTAPVSLGPRGLPNGA